MNAEAVARLRGIVDCVPSGFRDEDGVWHAGPLRDYARAALQTIIEDAEQAERDLANARELPK